MRRKQPRLHATVTLRSLACAAGLALLIAAPVHAQSADSPTCTPPPPPQPAVKPEPWLIVGAGAALGVLNLPSIALGPELLAQIDAGWPIDLSIAYFLPNAAELSDSELNLKLHPAIDVLFPAEGSRLKMSLLQVSAGTCPVRFRLQSGSLLACAGLYGGVLRGEAEGLLDESNEARLLLGAEAYARWLFRIAGPIGITYSAGLFVPFMRDRFGYADRKGAFRELYREPSLGGRLDVALGWWFE